MFRAVSHQLHSREEFHLELPSVAQIRNFGMQCSALFLLMDRIQNTLKQFYNQEGVELQLISDYFSVPMFIGMPNSEGAHHWCAFKPKFDAFPQGSISKLPMPGYPFSSKEGSHIEIAQNTLITAVLFSAGRY